jgi:hypothetical protein
MFVNIWLIDNIEVFVRLDDSVLIYMITFERWLNCSAPDCKSVVLGSNPAPPQHTANSVSPEVGSHLG